MNPISLVTVTHNSSPILEGFLSAIVSGRAPGDEIIVVDSGSSDIEQTRSITSKHKVTLIESPHNVGYGAGTNIGAAEAANGWLAIVNPDVTTTFASLHLLVEVAKREDISCLGPSIVDGFGKAPETARGTIRPPWRRTAPRRAASRTATTTESISGCCMVVRASDFHEAGGFDPYFFMFAEEIDLHKRLWESGKIVATTSAVTVMTPGGGSSSTVSARWSMTERDVAHVRFVNKHFTMLEAAIDLAWRYARIARGGPYKPRMESLRQLTRGVREHRSRHLT